VKFYFLHAFVVRVWISDFAHRTMVRNKRDGKPSLARSLYAHARPHRVCVCTRPRASPEFNFQLDLSGRHCQEKLSEPISRRSARTNQILANQADSFVSLFTTNPWKGKRGGDRITTIRIRKIDELVKNNDAIVRTELEFLNELFVVLQRNKVLSWKATLFACKRILKCQISAI